MMSTKPLENNLRCHPLKSLGVTLIVIYLNLCLLRNMTYCHCLKFPSSVITRLTLWRSDEWWPPRDEVECRMGCSPGGLIEIPGPPSSPSAPWRAPCSGAGRVPPIWSGSPTSPGGGGGGGSAVAARTSAALSPWTNWGKGVEAGGW